MLKEYKSYKRKKKNNYFFVILFIFCVFIATSFIFRKNISKLFLSDSEAIILKQYLEIEDKILKKEKIKEKKREYIINNLKIILEEKPKKLKPYYLYSLYYYYNFIYQNDFLFQNKKKLLKLAQDDFNHFLNEKNTQTIETLYSYLLKAEGINEKINEKNDYKFLLFFVDLFYSAKNKTLLKQEFNEIQTENLSQVFLNSYYFCAILFSVILGDREKIEILLNNQQVKQIYPFSSLEKLSLHTLGAYNMEDYVYCISLLKEMKKIDKKDEFYFYINFMKAKIFFIQKLPLKSINILNVLQEKSNKEEMEKINTLSKKIITEYPKLKTYFAWKISI